MCLLCIAAAAAAEPLGVAAKAALSSAPAAASTRGSPAFIVAGFVQPILFQFYGLKFYSYGVFVALACFLAFLVFGHDIVRARIGLDDMHCFFVFLAGFGIGSKAHVVLSPLMTGGSSLSWDTFLSFIDLRTGHSFIGSMIGCVVLLLLFIKWHGVRVLPFLDVLLPCCLLGHAIGKVGCFMSGDGCYGPPWDSPWAMSFPNGQVPTMVPVHPTPIYEGTCSFMIFVIARALFPLPSAPSEDGTGEVVGQFPKVGRRTALLLVLYGVERVVLENFRKHPPIDLFGGLSEYQALAVGLLIIGALIELFGSYFSREHVDERNTEKTSAEKQAKKTK